MITINKNTTKVERQAFDSALATLEESAKYTDGILGELAAAVHRESELNSELERLGLERKKALADSGGRVTQAIVDMRHERKECELELEDLADVQAELKAIAEEQTPGLYQLAAAAFNARESIGRKVAAELSVRKAELTRELGSILALEIKVESLGTPFNAHNFWRFGDGSPFEVLDSKIAKLAGYIKSSAEEARGVRELLSSAGIKEVPTGSLEKSRIGSPLASRVKKRA